MNQFELSAILYYADFLSMQSTSTTVTDTCKYFFVYGVPMNAAFIAGVEPEYDIQNQYFRKALDEYEVLKSKFGEDGVQTFLDNICNLGVAGSVNGITMLKYIHQYSNRYERSKAFRKYFEFRKNRKYNHTITGDDGLEQIECTKYVAHAEQAMQSSKRP